MTRLYAIKELNTVQTVIVYNFEGIRTGVDGNSVLLRRDLNLLKKKKV